MRLIVTLLVVLGTGVLVTCGSGAGAGSGAGRDCGRQGATSQPRASRTGATGSAGGSALVTPRRAPPPTAQSPPPPLPTPVGGRLALAAANSRQTVVIPPDTVIEVRLEPVSGSVWTLPESSDPRALPRLSASGACDPVKVATFRAAGDGEISASRPHGDAVATFVVTIRVAR